MKDDYGLDATYTYEEDDEWGDDEAAWAAEEEQEEEATDAKDESSAYLEFLNEEASDSLSQQLITLTNNPTGSEVRPSRERARTRLG